ncbi:MULTISPECIES: aminotransferase [unclassified Mesorhizobium]|uniref:SIS domain-containing protein n=1 Tax=unclassified Mesorhizobium TaxID=325217 RepID=UPI00333713F1
MDKTTVRRFSAGYVPRAVSALANRQGADAVLAECARQHRDAMLTVESNLGLAQTVARPIALGGRVLLLGMGASHFANQIAAARMRALGIDAIATPASEALYSPRPYDGPIIVTTQSGGSVEIQKWIANNGTKQVVAGMTLSPEQPFGDVPTFVGEGGPERAFAASRSFSITLAAFSTLLLALGGSVMEDTISPEEPVVEDAVDTLIEWLSSVSAFAVSGRASFEGVAAMTALGLAELGRIPAFSLEGGQMRHGPIEMLSPAVGVLLFRCAGASSKAWQGVIEACGRADAPLLVFDASGEPPLPGAKTIRFREGGGIASIYEMLPTQQALMLGLGAVHVADVGTPAFSSKVTRSE